MQASGIHPAGGHELGWQRKPKDEIGFLQADLAPTCEHSFTHAKSREPIGFYAIAWQAGIHEMYGTKIKRSL